MLQTSYTGLETLTWTKDLSTAVNPVPADDIVRTAWPGGMTTMITGSKPWAGGLIHTPGLSLVSGATLFTLSYSTMFPGSVLSLAQALEFDLMTVGPDGNVYNGSCQCVVAQGFKWQVTKAGGDWVDTGIKTPLLANSWNSVAAKFAIDWNSKVISCQSITVNSSSHLIPGSLQRVPFQPLAWQPNIVVVQRQLDLAGNGGCYSVDDKAITVTQE